MSAPGNVIDDDNESAASLLKEAVTDDREVSTDDVQKLAEELRAAKADIKAERESRLTHQKTAQEASTSLVSERERRLQAADEAVTNGIAATQADVDRFTAEAARAMEEGRYQDAAKFNRQAATAEMKLEGFEANKRQLASERERIVAAPVDPKANLSPQTRAWIDAHPRFETDAVYQGWAVTADAEAKKKGLVPDSTEYFAYVDKRIQQNERAMSDEAEPVINTQTPAEREAAEIVEAPTRSNGASIAASPSRRAVPGNGGKTKSITLSADERDTANRLFADRFPTEKERLEHYVAMRQRKSEQNAA